LRGLSSGVCVGSGPVLVSRTQTLPAVAAAARREQGLGLHCRLEFGWSGVWDRLGVFGGEEEEGGVRSGPGEVRTILLFHSPSKQSCMVGSTLGVYSLGLILVSARTNKRHHHHHHWELNHLWPGDGYHCRWGRVILGGRVARTGSRQILIHGDSGGAVF
jgi:hypothetical protein